MVGTVLVRAASDPNAIPWLLLKAKSTDGPGTFGKVTYIQRVNTVGGSRQLYRGVGDGALHRPVFLLPGGRLTDHGRRMATILNDD